MSSTLAACSGVFCGGGALLNLALQRHSARNPDSWINRKVCINNNINDQQPVRSFLVTLLGQLLIYPFFFVTAWRSGVAREGGFAGWWWGASGAPPSAWENGFHAWGIGYFAQDAVVHRHELPALLQLHHVGSSVAIVCANLTPSWRGLVLVGGFVLELGSLLVQIADLGLAPRALGTAALRWTSVFGAGVVLHGACARAPSDVPGWITAALLFVVSAVRISESGGGGETKRDGKAS